MKHICWLVSLVALLVIGAEASAQEQNEPSAEPFNVEVAASRSAFTAVVRKARRLKSISYRVGWTLEVGEFQKLSEECLRYGRSEDIKALLGDENPIIRVLGLICLAKLVAPGDFVAVAKHLYGDRAEVRITNGCVLNQSATVGAIAQQLGEDRFFLVAEDKRPTR